MSYEGKEKTVGKVTRAAHHLTREQIKEKMKESKDKRQLVRWQIVNTALLQPRRAEDIATSLGVSVSTSHVKKIISRYNREGVEAIEIKSCGGRYHEYLSIEEEKKFLAPFWHHAEKESSQRKEKYTRRMKSELVVKSMKRRSIDS